MAAVSSQFKNLNYLALFISALNDVDLDISDQYGRATNTGEQT